MLGPLEVWDGNRGLDLGAGRHRAVLAFLLLHQGEAVSSERLVDELWDERAPASAAKLVHGYVSRLRRVLPPAAIQTRGDGYVLAPLDTDAAEFERLVTRAAEEPPEAAAETLRAALSLWRGPALAEFRYDQWAQAEMRRLESLRETAAERRIDADLELGRAERVIPELEELVIEHPLREHLHSQLMLALYRAGRQADALERFADARRRLVDELGIEPGTELQTMQRRVLAHDPELDARVPASARVDRAPALRRRSVLAAGTAGALAAAVAVPILALSSRGRTPNFPASNAIAAIEVASGKLVGSAALVAAPGPIIYGNGSVWVATPGNDTVLRIDPQTNTVQQTIGVGGAPAALAVGGGFVWVANSLGGTVSQIDPRTHGGQVVKHIDVGNAPTGVAYGDGALWVANSLDRTVTRVDPISEEVGPPVSVPAGADTVAVGNGSVWVVSETAGVLTRIDPHSRRITASIAVGNQPSAVAAGAGSIWVANTADGTVSRVDPATVHVQNVIQVGEGPSAIALTPDGKSVWVANELGGTLSRIDPSLAAVVETREVGSPPRSVAVDGERTFVAVAGANAAHRGGTLRVAVANPSGVYTPKLPKGLDPAVGYAEWELLTLTNDGLVGYGRGGGVESDRVVPDLALTLPAVTDGGRTYTFQVRRGIRYSTGRPSNPTTSVAASNGRSRSAATSRRARI